MDCIQTLQLYIEMFCFVLITLHLAGCTYAISFASPEKYTLISLPELCAKSNGDAHQSLDSDGQRAAILLSLGEAEDRNIKLRSNGLCKINFIAPERHMLAVAYLHGEEHDIDLQNTSCPLNMTVRNGVVGFRPNLCEYQGTSSIPNLYPRRLVLEVDTTMDTGWPQTTHKLIITSIGSESSVCLMKQNQFPCDWEQNHNKKWGGLTPKLCVSKHLACDGIVNCPLSGADEIKALCLTDDRGVVEKNLPRRGPHKGLSALIQEAAERAAANLAIHGRHAPGLNVSSIYIDTAAKNTRQNHTTETVIDTFPAPSLIYCLYIFCAFVFLCLLFCWYKVCQHVSRKYRLGQTQDIVQIQNSVEVNQTRNVEEEMELRTTSAETSTSVSASRALSDSFDSSLPPDYSTLFPPNKAS